MSGSCTVKLGTATADKNIPIGVPEYLPVEVPPAPESVATYDVNGPRLMISKIVNENFKSYAGIQVLGPFHKSFSSIVGPNGSGKSNVIDSMLFVFGYRANKIRSKKISVLLHNSEQHRNISSCTVSVHFQKIVDTGDGENDFDVVPESGFVVSRTAFKDNSSYYRVNDKKVTYKEVAALLRGSGIDLDHNRFLILQGEVEQIAMMKPKAQSEHEDGMLEFLEDIIGSSRFKEPIDELASRVDDLNEFRSEKLNRVKAVEKEKDDLQGAKNEAVEFLTLENEKVKNMNTLHQKFIHDLRLQENKAVEKKTDVLKDLHSFENQMSLLVHDKNERLAEHKHLSRKYESLVKDTEERKTEFNKFEQEDLKCREALKHAKSKSKKLEKTIEQERKKLEELTMIPDKMKEEVAELNKKFDKLSKDKDREEAKLAEVMESLKTETQELQTEKESKELELVGLEKIENNAKSEYQVKKSEHELYLKNLNAETSKLRETERNLDRVSSTLRERQRSLKDIEIKLPNIHTELKNSQRALEEAKEDECRISNQVKSSKLRVEEVKGSLQSAWSSNNVLNSLMKLKENGTLPGVFGRLGDLGAIDEKYDIAISTACPALDNIVTDTIETAQRCVNHLRDNKVGAATFIALDKMDRWKNHINQKIKTPEGVPRLFDLVEPREQRLLGAFYHALRDTLVADNIDQASRIAYGKSRFKVVTVDGQVIDTSGTMTGGGKKVIRGRMGSCVRADINPADLQRMENKLQAESREAQGCREKIITLEDDVLRLDKSRATLDHSLQKLKLEIASLADQEESLEQQKKEQIQRVMDATPDQGQLKLLEDTVGAKLEAYESAAEKSSLKKDEVHGLHKQIMAIGGTKMKSAQAKVNMVQAQLDQIQGLITKSNVSVKTANRNAKKTEDKIKAQEEELQEIRENMLSHEEKFKQLEKDAMNVMKEYNEANEESAQAAKEIEEVQKKIAHFEEEENQIGRKIIEVKHEVEKYDNSISDLQNKIRHWKKELKKNRLHQIEQENIPELEVLSEETLANTDGESVQYEIEVLEGKLNQMKPNMAAIAEYRKKEEMYLKRVTELDHITDMRDDQRKLHDDLRKQRLDEFMCGFTKITDKLKEMYQMITLGGDAELELVDSLDPFSEGIVFSVRPPKKSWKNISNLSGGEKTLSSLALVFALHHYKPTPLYVMDEIDAALDFKNVSIIANYIKERTRNAQFIIISLRSNMFEMADRLIGIYKTNNCTKSCPVNPMKIHIPAGEQAHSSA